MKYLFLLLVAFFSCTILAWDGSVAGKIHSIEVTQGNNFGFRITLEGAPKFCGNENSWAFLNELDSNYQTYVSVLLAAKAAKLDVIIYSTRENVSGYCRIGHILVQ